VSSSSLRKRPWEIRVTNVGAWKITKSRVILLARCCLFSFPTPVIFSTSWWNFNPPRHQGYAPFLKGPSWICIPLQCNDYEVLSVSVGTSLSVITKVNAQSAGTRWVWSLPRGRVCITVCLAKAERMKLWLEQQVVCLNSGLTAPFLWHRSTDSIKHETEADTCSAPLLQ